MLLKPWYGRNPWNNSGNNRGNQRTSISVWKPNVFPCSIHLIITTTTAILQPGWSGKGSEQDQNCRSTEATSSEIVGIGTTNEKKNGKFWCQIFDLSKLNSQEQMVQECIDVALADVHQLQEQINAKYSQVHSLHDGETEGVTLGRESCRSLPLLRLPLPSPKKKYHSS